VTFPEDYEIKHLSLSSGIVFTKGKISSKTITPVIKRLRNLSVKRLNLASS